MPKHIIKDLPCDEPGSLVTKTRKLLKRDKRTNLQLHIESGVPYFWLQEFKKENCSIGSVNRVQYLYEFLSGRKLKV